MRERVEILGGAAGRDSARRCHARLGGLVTAGKIARACPATRIVMLTVSEDEDDLLTAFKAGACGYVLKGVSAGELTRIIRAVAGGEVYVSPALAAGMLVELTREKPPDPLEELTERERKALNLVSEGLTNREIGERLHLAEKTIKHYMTNMDCPGARRLPSIS